MVTLRGERAGVGRLDGWWSVVSRWVTVVGAVAGLFIVLTPLLLSIPILGRYLFTGKISNASAVLTEALFNISLTDLLSLIRFHQTQRGLTWPVKRLDLPARDQPLNGSIAGDPDATVHCYVDG